MDDLFKKIESERYYNIKDIFTGGFFFWYSDYGGVFRTVKKDYLGDNRLKTIMVKGNGRNTYSIKGDNIKKYIQDMIDRKL